MYTIGAYDIVPNCASIIIFVARNPPTPLLITTTKSQPKAQGPITPPWFPVEWTHSKKRVSTRAGRPRSEEQVSPRQGAG